MIILLLNILKSLTIFNFSTFIFCRTSQLYNQSVDLAHYFGLYFIIPNLTKNQDIINVKPRR